MNDRQIIEALRERDPAALAAAYDQYAESLFDYGGWLLEDRGAAAHAVRDSFIAASVHAAALRLPEQLGPWLYALTRRECLRRHPATPHAAEPVDAPDEARALAREAVMALARADREALILHVRHGLDVESLVPVLRMPPADVRELVDRARGRAEAGLRAALLARTDPGPCRELPGIVAEHTGPLTEQARERLDGHLQDCPSCRERTPRRVSMARIVGLLPSTTPPRELRSRTLRACVDPQLVDYRLGVARHMEPLDADGFPSDPATDTRWPAWRPAVAAVVGSLVVAALLAAAFLLVVRPLTGDVGPVQRFRDAMSGTVAARPTRAAQTYPADPDDRAGHGAAVQYRGPGQARRPDPSGRGSPMRPVAPAFPRRAGGVAPDGGGLWGGSGGGGAATSQPSGTVTTQTVGPGGSDGTGSDPSGSPSGRPTSGSSGSSSPSPSSPSEGALAISPRQLDLGTGDRGQVTLEAQGGPVDWAAGTSTSCLTVDPGSGPLADGQRATVTIAVSRNGGCPSSGQGTVTFSPGGGQVQVSWSGPPSSSSPSPTGSADPSPSG